MFGPRTLAWPRGALLQGVQGVCRPCPGLCCSVVSAEEGVNLAWFLRVWTRGVEYSAPERCHSWPPSLVWSVQTTPEGVLALSIRICSRSWNRSAARVLRT